MLDMVFASRRGFKGGHGLTWQAFGRARPSVAQGNPNVSTRTDADSQTGDIGAFVRPCPVR